MPFTEIKFFKDYIKIASYGISVTKKLRKHLPNKVNVFYDEEQQLVGLKNADEGYTFHNERLSCRIMPPKTHGKYNAHWDKEREMVVAELTNPLES